MIRLKNKNTIVLKKQLEGEQHIKENLKNTIFENHLNIVNGISIEDLDNAIVKFFNDELKLVIDGEHIEAELYGIQRFYEFLKNWENTDNTDNVKLPLLSIVRNPITKRGTNFDKITYNIPNDERYSVFAVPVVENGKKNIIHYKIPQPLNVDIEYEINFISAFQRDINIYNEMILFAFQYSQLYVNVLGHDMQIKMIDESDNSKKELNARPYYYYTFKIKLTGYLINEEDIEIVKVFNKVNLRTNIVKDINENVIINESNFNNCDNVYILTIPSKEHTITYTATSDIEILYSNRDDSNIVYYVNDIEVQLPFNLNKDDVLKITHNINTNKKVVVKLYTNSI